MSGMTAQVFFVVDSARDVLHVPVAAVKRGGRGQWQVQRLGREGKPQNKPVTAGISNRVRTVIQDGLQEGDIVVLGQAQASPAGEAEKGGRRRGGLF